MNCSHSHERILNFAVTTGELMMKSGAETYRVEDTISRILMKHNFESVDTFVVPTGIMVTISAEASVPTTKVVRVKGRTSRLDKIEHINQLSRDFVDGTISLESAETKLKEIEKLEGYGDIELILWTAISCGFFSIMFNGKSPEFVISIFIGFLTGYLKLLLTRRQIINFFVLFLCSLFIGFGVMLIRFISGNTSSLEPIIIGCIMPLLPGVAFTNAVRDVIGDELLSGIARGAEALIIAVAIASGIGVSLGISVWLGGVL